jgi:hypothetical protein
VTFRTPVNAANLSGPEQQEVNTRENARLFGDTSVFFDFSLLGVRQRSKKKMRVNCRLGCDLEKLRFSRVRDISKFTDTGIAKDWHL